MGMIAGAAGRLTAGVSCGAFATGILLWSLVEYLMHRFAFHGFAPHYQHHTNPSNSAFILAPLWLALSGAAAVWMMLVLISGSWAAANCMLSGVVCGYISYELVHLRIHSDRPGGTLLRALRKHHYYHHFASENACFGVTSPLWDLIFRSTAGRSGANRQTGTLR